MPNIPTAITVNVTVVSPSQTTSGWGAAAIVGMSTYATKNTPGRYTSLASVTSDHGADSPVGLAAASAFAQGISSIWAVSIDAASTNPTATEVTAALNTLLSISNETINAVCLAGIYSDSTDIVEALQTWADSNDKIFVVTNPKGATVSQITTAASTLASARGIFAAHNTPSSETTFTDDVAAAVLATLIKSKPGDTLMWAAVNLPSTLGQYLQSEQSTLETGHVNYIINLQNNGQMRLSNDLTLATASDAAKYIDITISRMYVTSRLTNDLANYRISTRKVPFTARGIEYVRSVIISTLESLVTEGVLADYSVNMPAMSDISASDIADRKLTGITVNVTLAGNMHTFTINLTMEAA